MRTIFFKCFELSMAFALVGLATGNSEYAGLAQQFPCSITINIQGSSEGLVGESLTFEGQATVGICSTQPTFNWILRSAPPEAKPWSAAGQQVTFTPNVAGEHVLNLQVTADKGEQKAFASKDFTLIVGQKETSCPPTQPYTYCKLQDTRQVMILSAAFNLDGKLVAIGDEDDTIKLWDVATGAEVRTLSGHADLVTSVVFNPDGKLLASSSCRKLSGFGCDQGEVKLWEVSTGIEVHSFQDLSDRAASVAFSPDGKLLAVGSCEEKASEHCGMMDADMGVIKLWEVTTGNLVRTLSSGFGSNIVSSLAFSPNGKLLAAGDASRRLPSGEYHPAVDLWEVPTGKMLRTLLGDSSTVNFSPDGQLLASGLRLWYLGDLAGSAQAH